MSAEQAQVDALIREETERVRAAYEAEEERLRRGDALADAGDYEAARREWFEVAPEVRVPVPLDGLDDVTRAARLRFYLVGRPPPRIGPTEALGGEPVTWDALRGKIVIAHVFWTYCNPCRDTMQRLAELRREHPDDDLVILGLASFVPLGQPGGRIPQSSESLLSPVSHVDTPDAAAFREHLIEFRDVARIPYPWLIQDPAHYLRWCVPENHPVLLVDRDGIVRAAARGPNLEQLRGTLDSLLGAPR